MIPDAAVLPWATPLLYLAGALATQAIADDARRWRLAGRIAAVAPLAALATALFGIGQGAKVDTIGLIMVLLVGLIGWVIVRYSARYLAGQRGQRGYAVATLLTLAAVCTVALSRHLGLLVGAWIASSLALHPLLTFFRERPQALVVAHKKFLASRLAELCLLGALVLIHAELGTLSLPAIADALGASAGTVGLPAGLQAAALLVVLAVILKSAQLPVHGWLIQVMEAPTPVSALLHAGIVNLGGFVLIRLAALITAVPAAQTLLVVIGSLTAVLAGLIMMTRISIKVRLAWSTCAQMGFMLMECGLGLYDLALLHLVAHSLYKAHAFLGAGGRVAEYRLGLLGGSSADSHGAARRMIASLAAAVLALGVVAGLAAAWSAGFAAPQLPWIVTVILGLGLAPLLGARPGDLPLGLLRVAVVVFAYLVWHAVAGALTGLPVATPPALAVWSAACFVALYGVQTVLRSAPQGWLARALHAPIHAGLHLDERFQRLTLRIWPAPRVNPSPALRSRNPITEPRGEHP